MRELRGRLGPARVVAVLALATSACGSVAGTGAAYDRDVDGWMNEVCDGEVETPPSGAEDPLTGQRAAVEVDLEPTATRWCREPSYSVRAYEVDGDPRAELEAFEPSADYTFDCWARPLDEGRWAVFVVVEYQMDDDALEPLEGEGFEPC